jgi:hypothetical protein
MSSKKLAYKLLRKREDGTLGPLFVGRDKVIKLDCEYEAEHNLPHPGLAHRPGFHCCAKPVAPHLKMKLKNGEIRVWVLVEIGDYVTIVRPKSQGGVWYLARHMTALREIDPVRRRNDKSAEPGQAGRRAGLRDPV